MQENLQIEQAPVAVILAPQLNIRARQLGFEGIGNTPLIAILPQLSAGRCHLVIQVRDRIQVELNAQGIHRIFPGERLDSQRSVQYHLWKKRSEMGRIYVTGMRHQDARAIPTQLT